MAKPSIKSGTHVAKQAFFHGQGDGKRVVDVDRLAEIGGISKATIYLNLPKWRQEYEEILTGATEAGISLRLSSETLATHKANTQALETLCDELRNQLDRLPELQKLLLGILSEFRAAGADPLQLAAMMSIHNAWVETCGTKKALQAQLIAAHKAWKESAGIDSLFAVTETREKTLAGGRAKLEIEKERLAAGAGNPESAPPARPGSRDSVFGAAKPVPLEEDLPEGMA